MTYTKANSAILKRIKYGNIEEYDLNAGEGIVFYKLGSIFRGDRKEAFKKAKFALEQNLLDAFAVLDEDIGLLISPSLNPEEAVSAFLDEELLIEKNSVELTTDNMVKYQGFLSI